MSLTDPLSPATLRFLRIKVRGRNPIHYESRFIMDVGNEIGLADMDAECAAKHKSPGSRGDGQGNCCYLRGVRFEDVPFRVHVA